MTMVTEMQQTLDEKIALILAKHAPMDIVVDHEDYIVYSLEASDIETQWHDYNDKIEYVSTFWFDEMMDDDVANQIKS